MNKDKERIKELFKTGRVLFYSDIVRELGIDLEKVVKICGELMKKGEIGAATLRGGYWR